MVVYGKTQMGSKKGRSKNEDRILINKDIYHDGETMAFLRDQYVLGIADGVGGYPGGDIASEYICDEISKITPCNQEELLKDLTKINEGLKKIAESDDRYTFMGSTFTGIITIKNDVLLFYIGNTRAYSLLDGHLKQLTHDQTLYQSLIDMNKIEESETCNKNVITSCFGCGNKKNFDLCISNIGDFQKIIFTTDGIHDHISTDEMEKLMNDEYPDEDMIISALMDKASENGSDDDMTVLIIEK